MIGCQMVLAGQIGLELSLSTIGTPLNNNNNKIFFLFFLFYMSTLLYTLTLDVQNLKIKFFKPLLLVCIGVPVVLGDGYGLIWPP